MIHPEQTSTTLDAYLAREVNAEYKSEYRDGQVVALASASSNHNLIAGNMYIALRQALGKRPYRVYVNDMRLYVKKSKLYTYPDVIVVCGKVDFVSGRRDTLTNPTVIIEVWSDSTRDYDRGEKFGMYRGLASLQDYVMIDQDQVHAEHYRRDGHFWVLEALDDVQGSLKLSSIEVQVPLREIYSQVEWEDKPIRGKRPK